MSNTTALLGIVIACLAILLVGSWLMRDDDEGDDE